MTSRPVSDDQARDVIAYLESERENLVADNEEADSRIRILETKLANYETLLAMSEADHQRILADYRELLDGRADLISKYARLVDILLALAEDDPLPRVDPPQNFRAVLSQGLLSQGFVRVRPVSDD